VQAAVKGTIQSINVIKNQPVTQGDIIAYIDNSQMQTQKNQLEQF